MILFNPHSNFLRKGVASPFERWGNWDSKWELAHCHPTENLTHDACYQIVPVGTLPPPSPSLWPQTPFFQRRLAALVPGHPRLPPCRCWSAAGHHATPHARRLLRVGAQEACQGFVSAEWGGPSGCFKLVLFRSAQQPQWKALFSPLQNVQLLLWQEPGCLPAWNQLLQILSSAFISQFLARACGLQIKMSHSRCAAEHTDPGHHAAPFKASCLRLPAWGPFRHEREAATLTKFCTVFCFSFFEWVYVYCRKCGEYRKAQKTNNDSFSKYFLSTCYVLSFMLNVTDTDMNNPFPVFPSLKDNHY